MKVSKTDIIYKIEKILSDILSDKYEADIKIQFVKEEE